MEKLTSENFESVVNQQNGLFVIKFFSPTCGPCKTMTPVVETLDKNNPKINIFEIDTSASPELAAHFGVRGVPTITFCENREVLYNFVGLTSLGDMQYVIDNIDNEYFREHGEFESPPKQKDWVFYGVIFAIVSILVAAVAFS